MSLVPQAHATFEGSGIRKSIPGIRILGTGSYAPEKIVRNEDLATLGYDADWIVQRTGILARHHVNEGQASSDLAVEAARRCLEQANVDPSEIDFDFWFATMTADHYTPSTAALVQAALGCQASAIDMNAACSGFMYALIIGSQFIKTGCSRRALVIGSDVMSMVVDPQDKKTYPLFGDGAGAALLGPDENSDPKAASGILSYHLASEGELGHLLVIPGCGSRMPVNERVLADRDQYLKMEGRAVFKWAVRLIPEAINGACESAGLEVDDLDLIILHQANRRIIDAALANMDIPEEKVAVNLDRYGNTSAASIPISLDEAFRQGKIQPGSKVFLCGFGAGLSWGTCIFQW